MDTLNKRLEQIKILSAKIEALVKVRDMLVVGPQKTLAHELLDQDIKYYKSQREELTVQQMKALKA